jgi:carbamoyl-phosphate synthase large subunit
VVNTPEGNGPHLDSRNIRSTATELRIPLFTTIAAAEVAAHAIKKMVKQEPVAVRAIQEYLQDAI